MDNSRDFRIKQSVWVQALEVYKGMEDLLKAEKEKQQGNIAYTKKHWQGTAADTMYSAFTGFLDSGDYAKAYEQVKKMRIFLEDSLPEINALLARCEGFMDQLTSDSYVEPIRPAVGNNAERNGGILSLNYNRIATIKNLCNEIEEENKSLRYELESIMDSCGGLVGGMHDELGVASAKLNRVSNYHDSFQRYEHGIRALESEMILALRSLISNTVKLRLESRMSGVGYGSGSGKLTDMYNLAYLSEEELRALVEQFTKVDDTEAMQVVAEQIFAKDYNLWSDAETSFIAQTFDYIVGCDNTELIEAYVKNMLFETYSEPKCMDVSYYTGNSTKYVTDYQVQANTQMLAVLMAQLDPSTQGEAYYTLNRIAKMQMDSVNLSLSSGEVQSPSGGANLVTVQLINGEIQLNFAVGTQKENTDSIKVKDSQVLTVCDMGKVITNDEMKELLKLGFTVEDIEQMKLSAVTDGDVKFVDSLANREYVEAFDITPCSISSAMAACLTSYLMDLEYADQTEEIQSMINGILQTSPQNSLCLNDTRGGYLDIIRSNLVEGIELANISVLGVESGSEEERAIIENAKRIYKQYGLWTAVDTIYNYDWGIDELGAYTHSFANGYCHAIISELEDGNGSADNQYDFKINLRFVEDGTDPLEGCYVRAELAKVANVDIAEAVLIEQVNELKEKRDVILVKAAADGMISLVDKGIPGTKECAALVKALAELDYENMTEAMLDFPYDEYCDSYKASTGKKITKDGIKKVIGAFFEYQNITNQINENEEILKEGIFSQAIQMDFRLYDEQDNIIQGSDSEMLVRNGFILPQTTLNIQKWNERGLDVYLESLKYDEEQIRDIKGALMREYAGDLDWQLIIHGTTESTKTIIDISPSKLSTYIMYIENEMHEDYGTENGSVRKWFVEE